MMYRWFKSVHILMLAVPLNFESPCFFDVPDNPQNLPFLLVIWTRSNTWFLGPTRVDPLNVISIGSAIFAGPTNVTNRLTDWH